MGLRLILFYLTLPINVGIIFKRPVWGIMILAAGYFVRPDLWGAPSFLRPIFIFTVITTLALFVNKSPKEWRFPPNLKFLVLMLVVMFISTMFAIVAKQAAMETNIFMLKLFFLFFLIVNIVDTSAKLNAVYWALMFGCAWATKAVVVHYLIEGVIHVDPLVGQGGGSNAFGTALVMTLPFLFFKIFSSQKWEKITAICFIPLWLISIVAVASRGAFLVLLIVGALLFLRSRRKVVLVVCLAAATVIFFHYAGQYFWERMDTITEYQHDTSAQIRMAQWQAGIRMFSEYPLTGVGPGNFPYLSPLYTGFRVQGGQGGGFVAHNTYIELLAETGFAGLLFYLLSVIITVAGLIKMKKTFVSNKILFDEYKDFVAISDALLLGIIAFSLHSVTRTTLKSDIDYWFLALSACSLYIGAEFIAAYKKEDTVKKKKIFHKRIKISAV